MPQEMDPSLIGQIARLEAEHHHYNQQLLALLNKPYPSADDELEEVRLKKHKLHIKDQLESLIHAS